MVSDSRLLYVELLDHTYQQSLKQAHPDWSLEKRKSEARKTTERELTKGVTNWFGLDKNKLTKWFEEHRDIDKEREESEDEVTEEDSGDDVGTEPNTEVEEDGWENEGDEGSVGDEPTIDDLKVGENSDKDV
jgi:hypothetical protein